MDNQDVKQAGLAGEFLADNENTAPPEAQNTIKAIGVPSGASAADDSAKAQKRANVVLAILFLAGMGVVYFMSMHDKKVEANPLEIASETIVNSAVLQFQANPNSVTGDPPENTNQADRNPVELAREMITGISKRQVPLKELKNNPFMLIRQKRAKPTKAKPTRKSGSTPGLDALRKAETLQLQSIVVANDRPLAIISERLLTVGQEIKGWKVHKIGSGQVILKCYDLSYVLRVKQ